MIDAFRINPTTYLSFTACRKNLNGDVSVLMRIHSFLEHWGLINYKIPAQKIPSQMAPPRTGHFNIVYDTPQGLFPNFSTVKNVIDPSKQHQTATNQDQASKIDQVDIVSSYDTEKVKENQINNGDENRGNFFWN